MLLRRLPDEDDCRAVLNRLDLLDLSGLNKLEGDIPKLSQQVLILPKKTLDKQCYEACSIVCKENEIIQGSLNMTISVTLKEILLSLNVTDPSLDVVQFVSSHPKKSDSNQGDIEDEISDWFNNDFELLGESGTDSMTLEDNEVGSDVFIKQGNFQFSPISKVISKTKKPMRNVVKIDDFSQQSKFEGGAKVFPILQTVESNLSTEHITNLLKLCNKYDDFRKAICEQSVGSDGVKASPIFRITANELSKDHITELLRLCNEYDDFRKAICEQSVGSNGVKASPIFRITEKELSKDDITELLRLCNEYDDFRKAICEQSVFSNGVKVSPIFCLIKKSLGNEHITELLSLCNKYDDCRKAIFEQSMGRDGAKASPILGIMEKELSKDDITELLRLCNEYDDFRKAICEQSMGRDGVKVSPIFLLIKKIMGQ